MEPLTELDVLRGTNTELRSRNRILLDELSAERSDLERMRAKLDTLQKVADVWRSMHGFTKELWLRDAKKLERIEELLERNGCDCECDCSAAEHDDDCERCLACRVAWILGDDR